MHLDVATGGELTSRWPPACRPSASCCTATTSRVDELRTARDGRRRAHRRRLASTSSTGSRRCTSPTALVPDGAAARHARRRGPHPRVRADRPGRLEVRVRRGRRATPREAVERGAGVAGGRAGRAARAHRQPGVRGRLLRARRSRCWRRSSTRLGLPELSIGGGLGVAYVEGEEAPTITAVGRRASHACAPSRHHAPVSRAEPGRSIVAAAAVTLYTRRHDQGPARHPHLRLGRRRHERQPAAGALRQRLRDVPARGPSTRTARGRSRVVGKHCESGDVLVRDAQRARRPRRRATSSPRPVTGAYGHSMGSNYNKVPAARRRVRARRRGARRRAPRDARRPAALRRLTRD